MDEQQQDWSVVMMCYNEVDSVREVVQKVQKVLKVISPQRNEIVIVNDGSTDGTTEVIEALLKEEGNENVRCIHHEQNSGIGQTLITGYTAVQYENVTAVPADGQFDPEELLPHANVPKGKFVSFYRVENTSYSFSRNALSWFNKTINKLFLGIRMKDVNWVKIYKNEEVKKIDFKIKSSLVESELCSKLLLSGNEVIEVESKYLPREHGESKGASFKIVLLAIRDIMALVWVIIRFRMGRKKKKG